MKTNIKSTVIAVLITVLVFLAGAGVFFTYKYFDLKNQTSTKITKEGVVSIVRTVIDDFTGKNFKESSIKSTKSISVANEVENEFTSYFNIDTTEYIALTTQIKNEVQSNVEHDSSLVSQYYDFMFCPFVLGAIVDNSLEFKVGEIFKSYYQIGQERLSETATAYGYCETTENMISLYYYDISSATGLGGVNIKIVLNEENDGYTFEFMQQNSRFSSFFRIVKNNELFLENSNHDTFAEIQGIRLDAGENKFDYILDFNLAQNKVFSAWTGSGMDYNKNYCENMNSTTFNKLYNKSFVENRVYDLEERMIDFFEID